MISNSAYSEEKTMLNVASFSTGVLSAIMVDRMIDRYGRDNTHIVFMDTTIEDDDNYRFMDDCRERWGGEIIVLRDGRDPYQVSKDAQIIPNQKIAPCTFKLKIELFRNWLATQDQPVRVHIGYDFEEFHRVERTKNAYESLGYEVDFPMLWKPYEVRPYTDVTRLDWGVEPPRMYEQGYSHANCGGRCVKQGKGDWERTLLYYPERYAEAEQWEREMRQHPKRKDYALLRDQRGGVVRAMTLEEFRLEIQSRNAGQMTMFSDSVHCIACGVGDLAVAI